MPLDIQFRSCSRVYAVHGNKRIVNATKSEIILRSLNSLVRSINLACGKDAAEIRLFVIDDHSDATCLAGISEILRFCRGETQLIHLQETGNAASLKFNYLHARDNAGELIYFVEDDYIHHPFAISEMLKAYRQFREFLGHHLVLSPTDENSLYYEPTLCRILTSEGRHWRGRTGTTGTLFTHREVLEKYWPRFMEFSTYGPESGAWEGNTINLIYQEIPCLSPMPALAIHLVDEKNAPPIVDWIQWWNDSSTRQQVMSPIVVLPEPHEDVSGQDEIRWTSLKMQESFKDAKIIEAKAGAVLGNHFHSSCHHYTYLVEGALNYHFRSAGSVEATRVTSVQSGRLIQTPPLVEYAIVFKEDSRLIRFASELLGGNNFEDGWTSAQVFPVPSKFML